MIRVTFAIYGFRKNRRLWILNSLISHLYFTAISLDSVYLFGTDDFGREILSRLIFGARFSLQISISVAILAAVFGTVLELVAGYYRKADYFLMCGF